MISAGPLPCSPSMSGAQELTSTDFDSLEPASCDPTLVKEIPENETDKLRAELSAVEEAEPHIIRYGTHGTVWPSYKCGIMRGAEEGKKFRGGFAGGSLLYFSRSLTETAVRPTALART